MFILHDILKPLQNEFSSSKLGNQRSRWFVYALLSFIIPFTSTEVSPKLKHNYHATMRSSVSMKYFFKDLG